MQFNTSPFSNASFLKSGFGSGFGPSVVTYAPDDSLYTGNEGIAPAATFSGSGFRRPGDMGRYIAFNDPGQPGEGFSNLLEYVAAGNTDPSSLPMSSALTGPIPATTSTGSAANLAPVNLVGNSADLGLDALGVKDTGAGFFPLPPPINNLLNPNRPMGSFTSDSNGLFSAPGYNGFIGSVNNGSQNSLSQQIPQAVQQAVTPLLQNTATQLNQGIGSLVNNQILGG